MDGRSHGSWVTCCMLKRQCLAAFAALSQSSVLATCGLQWPEVSVMLACELVLG